MLKQNPRTMYPIIVYRIAQKKNWGTSENLIGGLNLSTKFHREIMGRLTDLIISESQREWVREGDWLLRGTLVDSCAAASRSYASRNFKAARVKRGRRARRARSKFISHHRTDCSSFHEQLLSLSLSLSLFLSLFFSVAMVCTDTGSGVTAAVSVRIKRKLVRLGLAADAWDFRRVSRQPPLRFFFIGHGDWRNDSHSFVKRIRAKRSRISRCNRARHCSMYVREQNICRMYIFFFSLFFIDGTVDIFENKI